MKPNKCRVMCPDCGRPKMLFETEKKAMAFLKYNGDAVNPDGTREMRVYYCPGCCGYHISSHRYNGDNRNTDRMIETYRQEKGGTILDAINLCDQMIEQHFTTKSELNEWLRNQEGFSTETKDRARGRYYKYHTLK